MEWYVLNYDFNGKKVVHYNIFNNAKFIRGVNELLDNFITMEDFIAKLEKEARYCFWSKREYEISVGDAFEENLDKYEKLDVFYQILPNISVLAKYIVDYHNETVALGQ